MKEKYIWFILFLALFSSCKKDDVKVSSSDYLIFGTYHGHCADHKCVQIYRLEEDRLLEETTKVYPTTTEFHTAKYSKLSKQQYKDVKDLIHYFPDDLLLEPERVIGMPDAGDWGGIYVEYNYNGVWKQWFIDTKKENVPVKYHAFIDKINEKIALLQ